MLLLLLGNLISILSCLELLLPPDLNALHQLLLGALTELDPFVPFYRIWLSDKEVGDGEGVGVGRSGRLERLVRLQGRLERRELGAGALGVRPGFLVYVEVGQVCGELSMVKGAVLRTVLRGGRAKVERFLHGRSELRSCVLGLFNDARHGERMYAMCEVLCVRA